MRSDKATMKMELGCLSPDVLLKSSRGSSPAVHFSVKNAGSEESAGDLLHIRRQHLKF